MVYEGTRSRLSEPKLHNGPVIHEIYSHRPRWWARWTWPWLMGLTVWSAVAAQTAFYHWTQRVDVPSDASIHNKENAAIDSVTEKSTKWELRPLYQRVLMSGSILAFGTGLGIMLLSTRGRIVRRLYLVSHPVSQQMQKSGSIVQNGDLRYVLVETIVNTSGKGKVFLKENCELYPGRDDSEVVLKVPERRHFWLGLKDAMIEGVPIPQGTWAARQRLFERWGEKSIRDGGRWVRGPVVEDAP